MLKVTKCPDDPNVQVYGMHKYNIKYGILYKASKRKFFLDVLDKGRKETDIKEAIKNYNVELSNKRN